MMLHRTACQNNDSHTSSYRLGVPGFLTSEELRNAGYRSNNGLRDQRVALEWIHKHIRDFGGDPENLTAAGESAGGGEGEFLLSSILRD